MTKRGESFEDASRHINGAPQFGQTELDQHAQPVVQHLSSSGVSSRLIVEIKLDVTAAAEYLLK